MNSVTPLTRRGIDERLAAIEAKVPMLLQDRNTFPRAFEDEVERLLGEVSTQDHAYALEQLDTLVERSGYNP
jgi:hypothetical protein